MVLSEYLRVKKLSLAAFGGRIGVKPQSVHRYAKLGRIPVPETMARIVSETNGDVTPNDFFGVEIKPRGQRKAAA